MADEDEDVVIQEVDVYIAKTLADKLYLFQYPIRPADMTYDNVAHLGARIKPKQQKVELELGINTDSANYYDPRGEQIAQSVDNCLSGDKTDDYYKSDKMDKQVLVSSQCSASRSCYAAGVLTRGELHLTPLHGLVQLRPSFEYLNKGNANAKKAASLNNEDADSQGEEEDAKRLTVRFARPETDKAKAQRMSSFKYLEQKQAQEPWKSMKFHNPQDEISRCEHRQLYCRAVEYGCPEVSITPREYLKVLVPSTTKQERSQPKVPSNVLSMTQLKTMDVPDQVKALLINAKVLTFGQLCSLTSPVAKDSRVLKCVQQFADMVQGCWVVKSELLYPEDTISPHSGVAADILCRGRNYIMWRFTQSRVVVRKDIASVTKLPNEDIKAILEQVSRMRVAQGWEFRFPFDVEFINKHPDVYKQQLTVWEAKYEMLAQKMNLVDSKKASGAVVKNGDNQKGNTRQKANRDVQDEGAPRIATEAADLPVEVDCKDAAPNCHNLATFTKAPINIENLAEVLKVLQDFVCKKLNRTVLSLAEFKKLLLLRQTACQPGDVLCSGVPEALLEKAIVSAGATEIDMKWPPSTLQADIHTRRLFMFISVGDSSDQYREVLMGLFKKHFFVKRADFQTKATEVVGCAPTRKDWITLQQDLLEKGKHSCWYLRGTASLLTNLSQNKAL